jgi:3-deoxy-D-manno-octulosonate 8-phosphate phosphatase (KDO 8-P phosphatase)
VQDELTIAQRAARIRLAVFDVDGVLTDGRIVIDDNGVEHKHFHVHDGLGLQMLREAGIEVAILSARVAPAVAARMQKLGVDLVVQGSKNKVQGLRELAAKCAARLEEVAFMGDDFPDLGALTIAGLAASVPSAHEQAKRRAHWISQTAAGNGAVRELAELILSAQNKLTAIIERYIAVDQA